MEGFSISYNKAGQPISLAIDLINYDPILEDAVKSFLRAVDAINEEERNFWHGIGLHGLAKCYGDDEPEYTLADSIRKR